MHNSTCSFWSSTHLVHHFFMLFCCWLVGCFFVFFWWWGVKPFKKKIKSFPSWLNQELFSVIFYLKILFIYRANCNLSILCFFFLFLFFLSNFPNVFSFSFLSFSFLLFFLFSFLSPFFLPIFLFPAFFFPSFLFFCSFSPSHFLLLFFSCIP